MFQQVRRKLHRSNQTASLLPGQGFRQKIQGCCWGNWFSSLCTRERFQSCKCQRVKITPTKKKEANSSSVPTTRPLHSPVLWHWHIIGVWLCGIRHLRLMPPTQEYDSNAACWSCMILPIYVYLHPTYLTERSCISGLRGLVTKSWGPSEGEGRPPPRKKRHSRWNEKTCEVGKELVLKKHTKKNIKQWKNTRRFNKKFCEVGKKVKSQFPMSIIVYIISKNQRATTPRDKLDMIIIIKAKCWGHNQGTSFADVFPSGKV